MSYIRLISRLDIKGPNVIKGIQMEGLRVVGPVADVARRYYKQGVDEIIMIDTVASLYGRDSMVELIREVTTECFVPVTVGGGIRSVEDADALFRAGADKVAINTAAISRPELVEEVAQKYGSQAVVIHVEAKMSAENKWECFTEAGRQPTGLGVIDWITKAQDYGAGEFLLTNVDRDGTRRGVDLSLLELVRDSVRVPLIASSGAGSSAHVVQALQAAGFEGIAMGAGLHWGNFTLPECRRACIDVGISVRKVDSESG